MPRDKAPAIGAETLYPAIPQQAGDVRIHRSTAHARLTPVFGTACPPSGLSGRMRDFAYRVAESRILHWTTLMLADRVHVAEGLADDLARGHVPDLLRETGLATEWRYNRAGVVRKALAVGLVAAAWVALSRSRHHPMPRRAADPLR